MGSVFKSVIDRMFILSLVPVGSGCLFISDLDFLAVEFAVDEVDYYESDDTKC